MSDDDFDVPELGRRAKVLGFLVLLGVGLCGVLRFWQAVPLGAVLLLYVSDRGQHRWLVERFADLGRGKIALLTVGGHLLNNLFFCALAYIFGVGIPWLWGI